MAAPVFWSQNVSPNWKILFCITMARASDRALVGMSAKWDSRCIMKVAISWRAAGVRMLVYMLVASAMKRCALGGRSRVTSSSTRSLELRR